MAKPPALCDLTKTIQVVRRRLLPPLPGRAEPRHDFSQVVLTARAKVTTTTGVSDFARVTVGGREASDIIWVRWTPIEIDDRDRVLLWNGLLLAILNVENVDHQNRWLKFACASVGDDTVEAAL